MVGISDPHYLQICSSSQVCALEIRQQTHKKKRKEK